MPRNLQAQLRYLAIDSCLQRRQKQWTWGDLAEACGQALRDHNPQAADPARRTILSDIAMMRSGKLGYTAPIVVAQNRYYTYSDPNFSIHNSPLQTADLHQLQELLVLLKSFRSFSALQNLQSLVNRLEALLNHRRGREARTLIQFDILTGAPGQEWLNPLYTYVREKQVILLKYQPFTEPEPQHRILSPYLLKEYNRRWFVIGHEHGPEKVHTLALDRIQQVEPYMLLPFLENPRFHPEHWYRHLYGVSMPYDAKPVTIRLLATTERAAYLRTKPLHPSQQEIGPTSEGHIFEYYLLINFEWKQLLRSFGADIKLLEPDSLVQEIREDFRQAYERYH